MTLPNPSLTLIVLSWKLKGPGRPRLHRTTPESDISLGRRSFKGGQELFNGWVHKGAAEGVHAGMCVGLDNPRLNDGFYLSIVRDLSDTSSIWHDDASDKRALLDAGGHGPQLFDGGYHSFYTRGRRYPLISTTYTGVQVFGDTFALKLSDAKEFYGVLCGRSSQTWN